MQAHLADSNFVLQSLYAVTDQLISRRQLAVGHWWTAYPIPMLYAVVNIVHWAAGGRNEVRSKKQSLKNIKL
jgi:hypothetical protein